MSCPLRVTYVLTPDRGHGEDHRDSGDKAAFRPSLSRPGFQAEAPGSRLQLVHVLVRGHRRVRIAAGGFGWTAADAQLLAALHVCIPKDSRVLLRRALETDLRRLLLLLALQLL